MAKNYSTLREEIRADPRRREPIDEYRRAMLDALDLAALRQSRGMTQQCQADTLSVSQANISRIERQDDLYLSTLSSYVAALGGRLEVSAVFPDEVVHLFPRD